MTADVDDLATSCRHDRQLRRPPRASGWRRLIGDCQGLVNELTAAQTAAMAHLAAREDVALEDGTVVEEHRGLGHRRLDAPALVSEQLGLTDAGATTRVDTAVHLVTHLPEVVAVMGQGRLDAYRASIVSDELRDAPREVCQEVARVIVDSLGDAPGPVLRRRVRSALHFVDPKLLRQEAYRARSERSLRRWPGEPGVDVWSGCFPVEESRSGWAVVDGLARRYVREGRSADLERGRADALMDLVHARATEEFVIQLAVPASQVQAVEGEHGSDVVEVVGLGGEGTTHVRREWLESLLPTASPRRGPVRAEVLACADSNGALLTGPLPQTRRRAEAAEPNPVGLAGRTAARRRRRAVVPSSARYRPPQHLIDLVKARDGHCRFPGCTISARFCDVDHVVAWPRGSTDLDNLMCLCRRHHRIKQRVRSRVRIEPGATVVWTDPTGRRRRTDPVDFLLSPHPPALPSARLRGGGQTAGHPPDQHSTVADDPSARSGDWTAWEAELAHQIHSAEKHLTARASRRGVRAAGHDISCLGYRHRRHRAVSEEPPF